MFGDGSQTRSFCYVADLVDGLCRLMLSDEHYPVNLGNPCEMTVLNFAEQIRTMMRVSAPIEFRPLPQDDPTRRKPDITKARTILGWEPRVPLEEGLRRNIDCFRAAAFSPQVSPELFAHSVPGPDHAIEDEN